MAIPAGRLCAAPEHDRVAAPRTPSRQVARFPLTSAAACALPRACLRRHCMGGGFFSGAVKGGTTGRIRIPEDVAWRSATYGGATVIEDMGEAIAMRSVRIKMGALHLSMADCYCLALAEVVGGKVLTSDKGFGNAKTSADVILFR